MSEKFGLDWKKYPADRMSGFVLIAKLEAEEQKKKQGQDKPKNKFRPRQ